MVAKVPSYILKNSLLSQAKSEFAVLAILLLMDDIAKISSSLQLVVNMLCRIIEEADDMYEFAETLNRADEESYDVDEELQKVVDKYLREVFDNDTITAAQTRAEAQQTPEKKSYRSRDTKTTNDLPGRKRVREGTKEANIRQANRMNELRARKSSGKIKSPLEEEDICTNEIPKRIKLSVKNLPVMITAAAPKRDGIRSKVCSKHGHLTGTFSRSEVAYRKKYSKEILRIDPSIDDFKSKLS